MSEKITVKRVSKYDISKKHELFEFCDTETFHAKNLKNLANYILRQCFTSYTKDDATLTAEQKSLIQDVNRAIVNFNVKSEYLFEEKRPLRIQKATENLKKFLETSKTKTKKHNDKLKKLKNDLDKAKNGKYKPQSIVDGNNGLISYDFLNYYFSIHYSPKDIKYTNPYKDMATQTAQQTLRNLFKDWKSYFASVKQYKVSPTKFTGRPRLPKYKHKDGRVKTSFTNQSCKVRNGELIFPKTNLTLKIGFETDNLVLKEVRIIPRGMSYRVELVWDKVVNLEDTLDKNAFASIDLGLKNLATIVNNIGLAPIIINGKPLISINQYYNKKKASLQKLMPFSVIARYNKEKEILEYKKIQLSYSKQIDRLTQKRNNKIDDFMHKASKKVVEYCFDNGIGNIVIGKNEQWKTNVNLGKKNNQKFTSIPFNRFVEMITYKAESYGINVILSEESYTSKCSFLDLDVLPSLTASSEAKGNFSGKRITRGLYKTKNIVINADVNGAFNILRKVLPDMFLKENISRVQYIPTVLNIA